MEEIQPTMPEYVPGGLVMMSVLALVAGLVVSVVARPVIVLAAKTIAHPSVQPRRRNACFGRTFVTSQAGISSNMTS